MSRDCRKRKTVRARPRKTAVTDRGPGFAEVDLGVSEEQALREAGRCLALQPCDACDVCSLMCPDLCITRDAATGVVLIDLDYCKGCGICAAVCPKGAIRMTVEA